MYGNVAMKIEGNVFFPDFTGAGEVKTKEPPCEERSTDSLYRKNDVRKATKAEPFKDEKQYTSFKNALLSRRNGFRDYLMVVLQYTTGRRISDIVKLDIGDVYDLQTNKAKNSFEIFEKKTRKHKKVKIFAPAAEALDIYIASLVEKGVQLSDNTPLIRSQVQTKVDTADTNNLGRIQVPSAWRIYKEAAESCGITRDVTHISTHSPRKYLVKKHIERYNDVKLMTQFLNHAKEETTLIYACISDEKINDSLEAMF